MGPTGIRLLTIEDIDAASVKMYQTLKTGHQKINADENIVAEAMANIDAEYAALVAEAALVTV